MSNNKQAKNIIYSLDKKQLIPYQSIKNIQYTGTDGNITAARINNSFQQLLDNDLVLQNQFKNMESFSPGPKNYDAESINNAGNGYKAWKNNIESDIQILRKAYKDLSSTVEKNGVLTDNTFFTVEFDGNIFVGCESGLYIKADNSFDKINNSTTCKGYYIDEKITLFAMSDGIYQLKINYIYDNTTTDYTIEYSLVKRNSSFMPQCNKILHDKNTNKLYVATDQGLYSGTYSIDINTLIEFKKTMLITNQNSAEINVKVNDIFLLDHNKEIDVDNDKVITTNKGIFQSVNDDNTVGDAQEFLSGKKCRDSVTIDDITYVATDYGVFNLYSNQKIVDITDEIFCLAAIDTDTLYAGAAQKIYKIDLENKNYTIFTIANHNVNHIQIMKSDQNEDYLIIDAKTIVVGSNVEDIIVVNQNGEYAKFNNLSFTNATSLKTESNKLYIGDNDTLTVFNLNIDTITTNEIDNFYPYYINGQIDNYSSRNTLDVIQTTFIEYEDEDIDDDDEDENIDNEDDYLDDEDGENIENLNESVKIQKTYVVCNNGLYTSPDNGPTLEFENVKRFIYNDDDTEISYIVNDNNVLSLFNDDFEEMSVEISEDDLRRSEQQYMNNVSVLCNTKNTITYTRSTDDNLWVINKNTLSCKSFQYGESLSITDFAETDRYKYVLQNGKLKNLIEEYPFQKSNTDKNENINAITAGSYQNTINKTNTVDLAFTALDDKVIVRYIIESDVEDDPTNDGQEQTILSNELSVSSHINDIWYDNAECIYICTNDRLIVYNLIPEYNEHNNISNFTFLETVPTYIDDIFASRQINSFKRIGNISLFSDDNGLSSSTLHDYLKLSVANDNAWTNQYVIGNVTFANNATNGWIIEEGLSNEVNELSGVKQYYTITLSSIDKVQFSEPVETIRSVRTYILHVYDDKIASYFFDNDSGLLVPETIIPSVTNIDNFKCINSIAVYSTTTRNVDNEDFVQFEEKTLFAAIATTNGRTVFKKFTIRGDATHDTAFSDLNVGIQSQNYEIQKIIETNIDKVYVGLTTSKLLCIISKFNYIEAYYPSTHMPFTNDIIYNNNTSSINGISSTSSGDICGLYSVNLSSNADNSRYVLNVNSLKDLDEPNVYAFEQTSMYGYSNRFYVDDEGSTVIKTIDVDNSTIQTNFTDDYIEGCHIRCFAVDDYNNTNILVTDNTIIYHQNTIEKLYDGSASYIQLYSNDGETLISSMFMTDDHNLKILTDIANPAQIITKLSIECAAFDSAGAIKALTTEKHFYDNLLDYPSDYIDYSNDQQLITSTSVNSLLNYDVLNTVAIGNVYENVNSSEQIALLTDLGVLYTTNTEVVIKINEIDFAENHNLRKIKIFDIVYAMSDNMILSYNSYNNEVKILYDSTAGILQDFYVIDDSDVYIKIDEKWKYNSITNTWDEIEFLANKDLNNIVKINYYYVCCTTDGLYTLTKKQLKLLYGDKLSEIQLADRTIDQIIPSSIPDNCYILTKEDTQPFNYIQYSCAYINDASISYGLQLTEMQYMIEMIDVPVEINTLIVFNNNGDDGNVFAIIDNNPYISNSSTTLHKLDDPRFRTANLTVYKGEFISDNYILYTDKGVFTSTGNGKSLLFKMIPTTFTGGVIEYGQCVKSTDKQYLIASDKGLFTLFNNEQPLSSSIFKNSIESYSIDSLIKYKVSNSLDYTFGYTNDDDFYNSDNGKKWKFILSLEDENHAKSSDYMEIHDVYFRNDFDVYFSTSYGLYRCVPSYELIDDTKKLTDADALRIFNDTQISLDNEFSVQLAQHNEDWHSNTGNIVESTISVLNGEYLGTDFSGLDLKSLAQKTENNSSLQILDDNVFEILTGENMYGEVRCTLSNHLVYNDNAECTYILKRYASGISELYINIPTTNTYYINHVIGVPNCKYEAKDIKRKNLNGFGIEKQTITGDISKYYSTFTIYVEDTMLSIKNIIDIQANGTSLPLKIYKDTQYANSEDDASMLYHSIVAQTRCLTDFSNIQEDEYGQYVFKFACFGTDAQSVKITAYDPLNGMGTNTFKVRFHPNGALGSMPDQNFTIGRERKLRPCSFKWPANNHHVFNCWTTQINPPDNTFEFNPPYESYSDKAFFRKNAPNVKKGDVIDLYASWIKYSFKDVNSSTNITLDDPSMEVFINGGGIIPDPDLGKCALIDYKGET